MIFAWMLTHSGRSASGGGWWWSAAGAAGMPASRSAAAAAAAALLLPLLPLPPLPLPLAATACRALRSVRYLALRLRVAMVEPAGGWADRTAATEGRGRVLQRTRDASPSGALLLVESTLVQAGGHWRRRVE